jgi:hypothetical protein
VAAESGLKQDARATLIEFNRATECERDNRLILPALVKLLSGRKSIHLRVHLA